MAIRMGIEGKLYHGTAGSTAATEVSNCRDVSIEISGVEADISMRASRIALTGLCMVEVSIEWEMNWSDTDASCSTLFGALANGTVLALRTKDYASGKGFDGDVVITKGPKKEPLKEGQKITFTAKPTYVTRLPNLYT